jgi:hypothetical protein
VFRDSKGNTEAKFQESGLAFVKHLQGSLRRRPEAAPVSLVYPHLIIGHYVNCGRCHTRRSQDVEARRADASAPNTRYSERVVGPFNLLSEQY